MGKDDIFLTRVNLVRGRESMAAFAELCGISVSTMRNYLTGETEPRLTDLRKIAEGAGVSIGWLVGEKEVSGPSNLTATGNGIVMAGRQVINANVTSNGGDHHLSEAQKLLYELDKQYGTEETRRAHIKQLEQIRDFIVKNFIGGSKD